MLPLRFVLGWCGVGVALVVGCSAGGGGDKVSGSGPSGGAGGNAAAGSGVGGLGFTSSATGTGSGLDGGQPKCDDAGHCTCINVGSLGKPAHYGAGNDDTDAFQTWLNTKSSATLDLLKDRTTITAELLGGYHVIILQALEDAEFGPFWQFSPDEIAALSAWVSAGGGLIALQGYGADAGEVDPVNQLLSFTGISYAKDDILGQCPNGDCYCWGNSVPMLGWQPGHPISANITQVGAFHGRSIQSGDAQLVVGENGTAYGVSKEIGQGKVFVFADEWVTYTSQWLGTGQQPPPNDPCYQKSADQVFQVPQFWYNVITWVAPETDCGFDIEDPAIIK